MGKHPTIQGSFQKSGLYIVSYLQLLSEYLLGFLASIMGVGGGFVMVPAMIY